MGLSPSTKGINLKEKFFWAPKPKLWGGEGPKTGFADDLIQGIVEKNV